MSNLDPQSPQPALHRIETPPNFFLPGLSFEQVAMQLLSSQFQASTREWQTTSSSFVALHAGNCSSRTFELCTPCFESHVGISLPDNPPAFEFRPPSHTDISGKTEVHRFVLTGSIAREVNQSLCQYGVQLHRKGDGIHRSNVGGFHSTETVFSGAGSSSEWYGALHNVLLEAIKMLETNGALGDSRRISSQRVTTATCAPLQVSGWVNVSSARDFNTLHDHGNALWSAVYYADAGVVTDDEVENSELLSLAGALILKTQLVAWSSDFGFLPIRPRAGDLWIFPAYVPHVVLPRTLDNTAADGDTSLGGRLRVSVACNIFRRSDPVSSCVRNSGHEEAVRYLLRQMEVQ